MPFVAKQNNELLLKNHEAHPTNSIPFLEVNALITKVCVRTMPWSWKRSYYNYKDI